jgi:hypothetical protein
MFLEDQFLPYDLESNLFDPTEDWISQYSSGSSTDVDESPTLSQDDSIGQDNYQNDYDEQYGRRLPQLTQPESDTSSEWGYDGGLISPTFDPVYSIQVDDDFEVDSWDRKYIDDATLQRLRTLYRVNRKRFAEVYSQHVPQIVDGVEYYGNDDLNDDFVEAEGPEIHQLVEKTDHTIKVAKCSKCKIKGRTCGKWKVKEQQACECDKVQFHKRKFQKTKTSKKKQRQQSRDEKLSKNVVGVCLEKYVVY